MPRSQRHLLEVYGYDSDMTKPNAAPTDITLSPATIANGAANGTVVGALAAVGDTDPREFYTFTLTSNPGGLFDILGSNLRKAAALTAGSKAITVQVRDAYGKTFSKALTVTVT